MKFRTKRDAWLTVTIWASVIILFWAGASPLFVPGAGVGGGSVIFIACFLFAGLISWLWIGTYYVLHDSFLMIHNGPKKIKIPYDSITKAKRVRSWIASTATSSDRIELLYGRFGFVHISPVEAESFLAELKKRSPHIEVER
ncbi:PH domain-containing protein [Brevibacillus migulae]|uniref:PH domain-containing protein n=1 Tax=Brevibacillus migulae TaxID=1644114 RepID=UPI00106E96C4|nr:PH domain-containing protein [Brevibacillus migulae]